MSRTPRLYVSAAAALTLLCAVAMMAAFFLLTWFDLPAGDVTGRALVTDDSIVLPGGVENTFLIVVPVIAAGTGLVALWDLLTGDTDRKVRVATALAGLVVLAYYYGLMLYQGTGDASLFDLAGPGFYVALIAAAGLVLQVLTPGSAPAADEPAITVPAPTPRRRWMVPFVWLRRQFVGAPVLVFLLGMWAGVELELRDGLPFVRFLGERKVPTLFGVDNLLEPFSKLDFSGVLSPFFPSPTGKSDAPLRASWDALRDLGQTFVDAFSTQGSRDPGFFRVVGQVFSYDMVIYVIPVIVIGLLLSRPASRLLARVPRSVSLVLHLLVLYGAIYRWGDPNDYRELVLIYMGVNIMLTVSLNLINGYMGEFSVGHAGFMAVGAYVSSILTMLAFTNSSVFGDALLSPEWGLPFGFIIALIAGGVAAALAGLMVAFPSFRTRGDYLAIVTLAVNFIVQGVINNIEAIGGPRGLNGVPLWSTLTWVFAITLVSIIIVRNLVTSTFGKGIIAIREDEIAAELMGVDTRHVKLVAFLVSSFIAGVAGGLFAHVLAYVNPATFGILKSTEVLVMVYLGGMGSITGSIVAAVVFTLMLEALRPLAVLKWVVLPFILILLMFYRPQGLFGFREINLNLGTKPDKSRYTLGEAGHDADSD